MRNSRFLLPFSLGVLSVLGVMIAAERTAPGVLGRAGSALHPGDAAGRPLVTAPEIVPAGSALKAPFDETIRVPAIPAVVAPADAGSGGLGLLIPVQGVTAGSLVDTYEQSRGQGRRHDAIDIMAPRGTPVVAVADGVVMKLFRSERGGITLYELAPDRRTIYYYAHLDRYATGIAEGQPLRRGQVLGYVGNTGDAGPGNYHLHFEVSTTADPRKYWGGTPENPYPLLR